MKCMCNVGDEGSPFDGYADSKLFKVNFTPPSKCGTIESQHEGTMDYLEITTWIKLLLHFCAAAITQRSPTPFELANNGHILDTLFNIVFKGSEFLAYYLRRMGIDEEGHNEDLCLLFQSQPLFLYGTLMAKPLLAWLLSGEAHNIDIVEHNIEKAVLHGFLRRKVVGKDYPAIIRGGESDEVTGILFTPRNIDDRRKLRNFEGDQYKLEKVAVISKSGVECEAFTYVWDGDRDELEDREWNFAEYEATRLEDWLALFEGVEFT